MILFTVVDRFRLLIFLTSDGYQWIGQSQTKKAQAANSVYERLTESLILDAD